MSTSVSLYVKALAKALDSGITTEHTHRSTLEALIKALDPKLQVLNDPQRIHVGSPDLVIRKPIAKGEYLPLGYVETKDVGVKLDEIEKSEQLLRYKRLSNLILTDYLEFRWFVDGKHRLTVMLAKRVNGKLKPLPDGEERLLNLLKSFLDHPVEDISSPKELAAKMAGLCKNIDGVISNAFAQREASELMQDLKSAFERTLLPDITDAQFADMFAQTLGYGLFAARIQHARSLSVHDEVIRPSFPSVHGGVRGGLPFTRTGAAREIPKSNPFLRNLFETMHSTALEDEPFIGFVDDLTAVLAHTDIEAVLKHFGKRTKQEDPILHFYETFLAEYDPELRNVLGVYYTPEPVVSYIVRSVDILLKEKFGLADGLADTSTIEVEVKEGDKFVKKTLPKVLILDPACGTGTFLYAVVDLIRNRFMEQGRAGEWQSFVREQLIPRIYGFELQMAPYAVAHLKLAMQLAGHDLESEALREKWGVELDDKQRLNVFLTNSLDYTEHRMQTELRGFIERTIAHEADAAYDVKGSLPILVLIGNPPYRGESANPNEYVEVVAPGSGYVLNGKSRIAGRKGARLKRQTFIGALMQDYFKLDGIPLKESNPKWINNDYVKFLRFAQWRIERTGHGMVGFITSHSYLDGPTFRGVRWNLHSLFDSIYIIDLHGDVNRKEKAPDGGPDKGVFDIEEGTSIGLFLKCEQNSVKKSVHRTDLFGQRESKFEWLKSNDISSTKWLECNPSKPYVRFDSTYESGGDEFLRYPSINRVFISGSTGVLTARDELTIHWTERESFDTTIKFANLSENEARVEFRLKKDAEDWRISWAQRDVLDSGQQMEFVQSIAYRPFDRRYLYYTGRSRGFVCRPRFEVMRNLLDGQNLSFICKRQSLDPTKKNYFGCSRLMVADGFFAADNKGRDTTFPLYLVPDEVEINLLQPRKPNLDPKFVQEFGEKLGLTFVEEGSFWSPSVHGGDGGGLDARDRAGLKSRSKAALNWKNIPKSHWQFANEMRKDPSAAEKKLWQALKTDKLGVTFRRQHPIGPFIADFYCSELRLVIEVDGATHASHEAQEYDAARDEHMRALGLTVLRFSNSAVLKGLDTVLESISACIRTPNNAIAQSQTPPIPPVNGGESVFGPEDVFYYIYAIFHSPTYRERYKEFLKIDFPRVPLTSDVELFAKLVPLGHELVQYHLLEHPSLGETPYRFPEKGDNLCEKIRYDEMHGRVYIN